MVIKPKAPRWYQWKDGQITPMYELAKKSGNGMKAYSLREARELKLLPSVTSVLSVIDKPELDNWRVSQAIHSALTLPRDRESCPEWVDRLFPGGSIPSDWQDNLCTAYDYPPKFLDTEDAFAKRVLADAEAQANKAAEFGTRIHDAIAAHLTSFEKEPDPDLVPFLMPFADWAMENIQEVHAVEKCVGHPSVGVAGRMDLDCTLKGIGRAKVDFKTQNIKEGKEPVWYQDWPLQLAAYDDCSPAHGEPSALVSVVINSRVPGPVYSNVWNTDGEVDFYELLKHALELWIYTKGGGYDPRQP